MCLNFGGFFVLLNTNHLQIWVNRFYMSKLYPLLKNTEIESRLTSIDMEQKTEIISNPYFIL